MHTKFKILIAKILITLYRRLRLPKKHSFKKAYFFRFSMRFYHTNKNFLQCITINLINRILHGKRKKQTFRLSESSWTSLRCFHASNAIAACLTSNRWLLTSEIISLNSSVQLRCFDPGDGDPGFRNKLWSSPTAPFSSRSSCWMLPFSIV